MDLVQRELTKLAAAAVVIDEMAKAAHAQEMEKQAKVNPGLIALLAALGLGGAAAGAYAGGAFDGGSGQSTPSDPNGNILKSLSSLMATARNAGGAYESGAPNKSKIRGYSGPRTSGHFERGKVPDARTEYIRDQARAQRGAKEYGEAVINSILGRTPAAPVGDRTDAARAIGRARRSISESFLGTGEPRSVDLGRFERLGL